MVRLFAEVVGTGIVVVVVDTFVADKQVLVPSSVKCLKDRVQCELHVVIFIQYANFEIVTKFVLLLYLWWRLL